jgi:hypothetical protein
MPSDGRRRQVFMRQLDEFLDLEQAPTAAGGLIQTQNMDE